MPEPTLRDVAELAGVSPRTVSNVVNGYVHVSAATRAKVEEAIETLDYRPNILARSLASGRSGQIVVVVPYLDTPYFSELLQAIIPRARDRGFNVLIDQTDGDPAHEAELLRRRARGFAYDGMIFSPLGLAQADLSQRDPDMPLVVLGERSSDGVFDHVGIDDVAASWEAVSHLISLGHRRIAAIGDQPYRTGEAAQRRTAGYRLAHEHAGVDVDESLVVVRPRFNRVDGAEAMRALLDRDDPPTAVFAYSDLVALGAIRTILQRGLRLPDDVAVIGYDDIEDGRYSTPTVSTIAPNKAGIAAAAVDRLLERIERSNDLPGKEIVCPYTLIPRESTIGTPASPATT